MPDAAILDTATVGEAVDTIRHRLGAAGFETPGLDARALVGGVLGCDAANVIVHLDRPIDGKVAETLDGFLARRLAYEPVSRILGCREFWSRRFELTGATLDPRADTETLVAAALDAIDATGGRERHLRIADLGTGSGCILVALLGELPNAKGVGIDISADALDVARRNTEINGCAKRADFVCADWLTGCVGRFDLIVSNPPYIPSAEISALDRQVAGYDPHLALDGGPDGLVAYRRIAGAARESLAPGGWLVAEIGAGQDDDVAAILAAEGFILAADGFGRVHDLGGRVRCLRARCDDGLCGD